MIFTVEQKPFRKDWLEKGENQFSDKPQNNFT